MVSARREQTVSTRRRCGLCNKLIFARIDGSARKHKSDALSKLFGKSILCEGSGKPTVRR